MRDRALWKKMIVTMMVLATGTAALAGCGSSDSSATTTASTAGSTTAETTTTEAADSTTSTASESGDVTTVEVAVGNAAAPFCYLDEDGNAVGYDDDVLRACDEILPQYEFNITPMSFSSCVVAIDSGSADMVAHGLVASEERKEKYIFPTENYSINPMCLLVTTDSGIEGFEQMKGKTIYCNPTQYEYTLLTEYNELHPETEYTIVPVSDMQAADMYRAVAEGTVDACLTYQSEYDTIAGELGYDNLMMTDPVLVEESYFMIDKDEQDLADALSEALKQLKDDGTISELEVQYFGADYYEEYGDLLDAMNPTNVTDSSTDTSTTSE